MCRLYSKARHLGYKRGKHTQHPLVSLLQIENVSSSKDACFYLGKRVAYVYRAKKAIDGSKTRVIWGKVARVHGNSGVVRARFAKALPPRSFGAAVRVVRLAAHLAYFVDALSIKHLADCRYAKFNKHYTR